MKGDGKMGRGAQNGVLRFSQGGIEMKKRFAMLAVGILLSAALAVPAYANAPFESPDGGGDGEALENADI